MTAPETARLFGATSWHTHPPSCRWTPAGSRLMVDGEGFVWWVHADGTMSMVRTDPSNRRSPDPWVFFAPVRDASLEDEWPTVEQVERACASVWDAEHARTWASATQAKDPPESRKREIAVLRDRMRVALLAAGPPPSSAQMSVEEVSAVSVEIWRHRAQWWLGRANAAERERDDWAQAAADAKRAARAFAEVLRSRACNRPCEDCRHIRELLAEHGYSGHEQ